MSLKFSVNYPDVILAIREYVANTPIQIHGKTYTNLREIGKGGFGIVYDCDQGVVLKIGQLPQKDFVSEVTATKLLGYLHIDDNADEPFFVMNHLGTRPKDLRGPVFGMVLRKMEGTAETPTTAEQSRYFIGQLLFSLVRSYCILEHYNVAHNDMKPANLLYATYPTKPYYNFQVSDFGSCVQYDGPSIVGIKQLGSSYSSSSAYDRYHSIRSASEFKPNESWEVTLTFLQLVLEKVLGIEWDPVENFPETYDAFEEDPEGCIDAFIQLLRGSGINDVSCEVGSFHISVVEDILRRFLKVPNGAFKYSLEKLNPSLSSIKQWGLAKIERVRREWPTFEPTGEYSREFVERTLREKSTLEDIVAYVDKIVQTYKNAITAQSFPFLNEISETYVPSIKIEMNYESVTRSRNKIGKSLVDKLREIDPTAVPLQSIKGLVEQITERTR